MAKQNTKNKLIPKNVGLKRKVHVSPILVAGVILVTAVAGAFVGSRYFGGSRAGTGEVCREDFQPYTGSVANYFNNIQPNGMEEQVWLNYVGVPAGVGAADPAFEMAFNARVSQVAQARLGNPGSSGDLLHSLSATEKNDACRLYNSGNMRRAQNIVF
jgi:hypothetical protein